jgi:hypothetical protein
VSTFPITSPGPLLPLDAPLPQPRRYTLLDGAQIVAEPDTRWLAGAWINGYPSGRPETQDPCSDGTFRLKNSEAVSARPMAGAFTVVQGGACTAKTIGPNSGWYTDRLALAFQAVESTAVERVFLDGGGHSTLGAYVADANLEILASGAAQARREGLALLENAIGQVGAGIIHITPALAAVWAGDYLIGVDRAGQMRTLGNGTLVVVGAGYIGVSPDAQHGFTSSQEWAYATGFVQVRRDDVTILPGVYSQALDRSNNEITFYAERDYLLSWVGRQDDSDDEHIQAAVLIDRTT